MGNKPDETDGGKLDAVIIIIIIIITRIIFMYGAVIMAKPLREFTRFI